MSIRQRVRARLGLEEQRAGLARVESTLRKHDSRLKAQRALIDRQQAVIANQRKRLGSQADRLAGLAERVEAVELRASRVGTVYAVLEQQIASMETRLDRLVTQVTDTTLPATEDERAEGRTLLEEIREEHSRIRARFGIMARYEERIRRLEAALKPVPGA